MHIIIGVIGPPTWSTHVIIHCFTVVIHKAMERITVGHTHRLPLPTHSPHSLILITVTWLYYVYSYSILYLLFCLISSPVASSKVNIRIYCIWKLDIDAGLIFTLAAFFPIQFLVHNIIYQIRYSNYYYIYHRFLFIVPNMVASVSCMCMYGYNINIAKEI